MKDYYKILGVTNDADKKEIQKKYRILARKYHPDVNKGDAKYNQIFADISEAYENLKDDDKRKKYDDSLNNHQSSGTNTKSNSRSENTSKNNSSTHTTKGNDATEFDFQSVNKSFEKFFGFDAKTGEVTNEDKLKNKNPLDTSDLFKKFMGF